MPRKKPDLISNLDKAYARIDKILSDPDTPMKDVIAAMRILAYYKGTAVKQPDATSTPDVTRFLNSIHKAS